MKIAGKLKWCFFLAMAASVLPSAALEKRKFYNSDKTKSFDATLTGYDAKKNTVTVQVAGGRTKTFSLDVLSKEDQKYVKDNAQTLAVAKDIVVSFKETKGKTTRSKAERLRRSTTPYGYDIKVYNRSKTPVEDLEVRYFYYYCVGSSSANGPRHTPKVQKGTITFPKLFGQYTETRKTANVELVRESKAGKAPPVPSGGGGARGGG